MEQQWNEEGEEDEPKKKRKAVSLTREDEGRVSHVGLISIVIPLKVFLDRSLRTFSATPEIFLRRVHTGFCPGHFYPDFNALIHRAVAFPQSNTIHAH